MTKVDLVSAEEVNAARHVIETLSPRTIPLLEVRNGEVDPRIILGLEAAAEDDLAARPSHHDGEPEHDHDEFESIVVELPEVDDRHALVAALEQLVRAHKVLRVKGYAAIAGKKMRLLIQAVGTRLQANFVGEFPEKGLRRQGQLVFIAEHDAMNEAEIRASLLKLAGR